jgi:hypothetical protein
MIKSEAFWLPILFLLWNAWAGCLGGSSHPTNLRERNVGEVEFIPSDSSGVRPQYFNGAGVPKPVGQYSFLYPDDLWGPGFASCDSGRAICPRGAPCLGWAEFSFSFDETGRAVAPLMKDACPSPVSTEPFLNAFDEWAFRRWREGRPVSEEWTSTTMVYPVPTDI